MPCRSQNIERISFPNDLIQGLFGRISLVCATVWINLLETPTHVEGDVGGEWGVMSLSSNYMPAGLISASPVMAIILLPHFIPSGPFLYLQHLLQEAGLGSANKAMQFGALDHSFIQGLSSPSLHAGEKEHGLLLLLLPWNAHVIHSIIYAD